MVDNRRQKDIDERPAIVAWRSGAYKQALENWDGRGPCE